MRIKEKIVIDLSIDIDADIIDNLDSAINFGQYQANIIGKNSPTIQNVSEYEVLNFQTKIQTS